MWEGQRLHRNKNIGLLLLVILAGLASRSRSLPLPHFFKEYGGDTLWALAAYLIVRALLLGMSIRRAAVVAALFSPTVELSQLYHALWVDQIRHTRVGGLVLGFGFLWSDLLCYKDVMTELSQEQAVSMFSELMAPFLSANSNPHLLIETVANFYRDFRIAGASVETDGDMLLLELGRTRPHLLSGFADFRHLSDEVIRFGTDELQWLGLTRQIFSPADEETEFDDEAIALCAYLFFEERGCVESSANIWVSSPGELNEKLEELLQNPLVINLVESEPLLVNAFVDYVG